jgi:demethylmenaquinone methyltransferase/2-methoxy-6-polyprenyl-1,4-benzoquinol methylase
MMYSKAESWKIFDAIYQKYDFLNNVLSLGFDKKWRNQLSSFVPQRPNLKVLDLATGTADVLITLVKDNPNIKTTIGIDLSENMLSFAKKKINDAKLTDRISLQHADATNLPFINNEFDLATMSFGIRNIANPITTLKEIYRVLHTNGRIVVLEFSLPRNILLRGFYLIYLKYFVPLVGGIFSGNFKAYFYLNRTIEKFPFGDVFVRMIQQCGFKNVTASPLLFGVATIYCGEKT